MLPLIEKYQVTKLVVVPVYLAQISNCQEIHATDLSSLKMVQSTGAKLTTDLKDGFKKFLSPHCILKSSYGCSEMSGMAYETNDNLFVLHPNIEARIVCPDSNEPLTTDEEGEILLRYKTPWLGYYNDVHSTRKVYENGWYRTGDLGHFDSNKFLLINSRIKDIIRLELCDISPLEIEAEIMKIPGIVLVVVVGIPDALEWNILAALVIKRPDSELTYQEIEIQVAIRKPCYKHLKGGVFFVESIPTTVNGKVSRRLATEQAMRLYNEKANNLIL